MKVTIIGLFVLSGLTGCFTSGTKTISKSGDPLYVSNIGYLPLTNDSVLSKVYPKTNEIYKDEVNNTFKQKGISNLKYIEAIMDYDNPDIETVKSICKNNNMDALLISKLTFIRHITVGKTIVGTEVDSKLYDIFGKLLVNASHNTLSDNTYR